MRPNLYIDTEFTDLLDMDLISIAIVGDGIEFYAERSDYDDTLCSPFTREAVLPQLGSVPATTWEVLAADLSAWLHALAPQEPILCFDNVIDYAHLRELLGSAPRWLGTRNIRDVMDQQARLDYFRLHGVKEHHALSDARANQYAHRMARQRQSP